MKKIVVFLATLTVLNSTAFAGTLNIGAASQQCSGSICKTTITDAGCEGQIAGIIIPNEGSPMEIGPPSTSFVLTGSVTTINGEVGGNVSSMECTLSSSATGFYVQNLIPFTTKSGTSPQRTTPTSPGTYTVDAKHTFAASIEGSSFWGENQRFVSYVVSNLTQCNDGINNDSDNLIDTLDPQCHTDCNVNNIATYSATHNSESVAPNGITCQASTLQPNGRAAFFQVVKNFFASITARAFAGE